MNNMTGSASVIINPLPVVYTVMGGGNYCASVHVTLNTSDPGSIYQLYNGNMAVGSTVGTVRVLCSDFGALTAVGTYTVSATNALTGCMNNMVGSATIAIDPLPAVYTVTGGGSYCAGGVGQLVGLSGSNAGINYQLLKRWYS